MKRRLSFFLVCLLVFGTSASHASMLTIDQIIYQASGGGTIVTPSLLSGTLDVTVSGSNQLTILMTNTSPDAAFAGTGATARMLLTGFGLQLPGVNIKNGTVAVNGSATPVNFDTWQDVSNISNQWQYANSTIDGYRTPGVMTVDRIVSSVNNGGGSRFVPLSTPPTDIDGPGYGALSSLESEFGGLTPGVKDTIKFVLNLTGPAPSFETINSGNVVLAFGLPSQIYTPSYSTIAEPSTLALYGLGLTMLVASSLWRRSRLVP